MMRTKVLSFAAMFVLGTFTVFAGEKTEKFKVKGNCGMCESRIEKAVNSLEGIESASWDKETQMLEVKYDELKATTMQIQTSLAMAGHDTEMFGASDKKYAELPGCCKYQRDDNRKTMNHGTAKECNHEQSQKPGCEHNGSSDSCCEN